MATVAPTRVNVRELRANLSSLLKAASAGATITVVSRDKVVAEIRPPTTPEPRPRRKLGAMKGEIWMADDWDTWPDDILASFEAPIDPVK